MSPPSSESSQGGIPSLAPSSPNCPRPEAKDSTTSLKNDEGKVDVDPILPQYEEFPAGSPEYIARRTQSAVLYQNYNNLSEAADPEIRGRMWAAICPHRASISTGFRPGTDVPIVKAPIWIDYGDNVQIHPSVFINRGVKIFDTPNTTIELGEGTAVGPDVRFLAVEHPHDARTRQRSMRDRPSGGRGIKIGKYVLVLTNATILPGTVIGDYAVINAHSVVKGYVPPMTFTDGQKMRPLPAKFGFADGDGEESGPAIGAEKTGRLGSESGSLSLLGAKHRIDPLAKPEWLRQWQASWEKEGSRVSEQLAKMENEGVDKTFFEMMQRRSADLIAQAEANIETGRVKAKF